MLKSVFPLHRRATNSMKSTYTIRTMAESIERLDSSVQMKERKSTIRQNVKEEKRIVFLCDANGIIIHKARPTLPPFNDFELDYV